LKSRVVKSITLMELILAIVLLGIIILAATSIDIASVSFFKSSDFKTRVLNEASLIMEHIQKNALQSHGWLRNQGVSPDTGGSYDYLRIRMDVKKLVDGNMQYTPANFDDDKWVRYYYDRDNSKLMYCNDWDESSGNCDGDEEILSEKIISCVFKRDSDRDPTVDVNITAQYNPGAVACGQDPRNNPCVNLKGNFLLGAHSFN